MRAFPRLSLLYENWKTEVEKPGNVRIVHCREVTRVKRNKKGLELWSRSTKGTNNDQLVVEPGEEQREEFDELILATDADAALHILDKDASWMEKKVLGNVKVLSTLSLGSL